MCRGGGYGVRSTMRYESVLKPTLIRQLSVRVARHLQRRVLREVAVLEMD